MFSSLCSHCTRRFLASLVAVFGEFDISGVLEPKQSVTKNIKRVVVHREYDAATFENDLALLELESPLHYDTHIGKYELKIFLSVCVGICRQPSLRLHAHFELCVMLITSNEDAGPAPTTLYLTRSTIQKRHNPICEQSHGRTLATNSDSLWALLTNRCNIHWLRASGFYST